MHRRRIQRLVLRRPDKIPGEDPEAVHVLLSRRVFFLVLLDEGIEVVLDCGTENVVVVCGGVAVAGGGGIVCDLAYGKVFWACM